LAVGDFNGDGLPDLAVANSYFSSVFILDNDGNWNGPGPRPGSALRRTFAPLETELPPRQAPEARWPQAPAAVDPPRNPPPHQPLLDWLRPASNEAEPFALPYALVRSEAWDAFFMAGIFDFDAWELAPPRYSGPAA
jgi:hypothetical protein